MKDRIDLHVHTLMSDGSDTPTAVVEKAARLGLRAIAITDHDTFAGIDEAAAAGRRLGVEVVPGVELSTMHDGEHVHLLAYYMDRKSPALLELMELAVRERVQRNETMVQRLHDAGYPIDMEEMRRAYPGQVMLGRPHVAALLMKKGVVPDIRTGVMELMGKGKPFYVERYHIPLVDYIRAVRRAGGMPVVAHLYQYRYTEPQRSAMVAAAAEAGCVGLEGMYSTYTPAQPRAVFQMAAEHGLICTGGSDYHGTRKPHISARRTQGAARYASRRELNTRTLQARGAGTGFPAHFDFLLRKQAICGRILF